VFDHRFQELVLGVDRGGRRRVERVEHRPQRDADYGVGSDPLALLRATAMEFLGEASARSRRSALRRTEYVAEKDARIIRAPKAPRLCPILQGRP
jgi:hypothetical protein